jgi:hypothetical protein
MYLIGITEVSLKAGIQFDDKAVSDSIQVFVERAVMEANRLGLEGRKLDAAMVLLERVDYGRIVGMACNVR